MFIYKDVKYISFVKKLDNDMILIVNVPSEELFAAIIKRLKYLLVSVFTFCISISGAMYYMFKKNINEPVDYLIETANKIGDGNLDTKMNIKDPKEFADLAKTFNKMTTDIKDYNTNLSVANAEKERMKT
jgi:sigma-B regulation protein RsbU (phosphoserine phosphatase)